MIAITPDQLKYRDDRCGLYLTPEGYVLIEYATGDARWMTAQQARHFMKICGQATTTSIATSQSELISPDHKAGRV